MANTITVTSSFVAFHCWPNAPDEVAFLRNMHRHKFGVQVTFPVTHNDRQLEFFIMKAHVNSVLSRYAGTETNMSCEQMAEAFVQRLREKDLPIVSCRVDEDGENWATVYAENVIDDRPKKEPALCVDKSKTRSRPFIGFEAEGPNIGARTLFIPSTWQIPAKRPKGIMRYLREKMTRWFGDNSLDMVYLGAGNNPVRDAIWLTQAIDYFREFCITAELDIDPAFHEQIRKALEKANRDIYIVSKSTELLMAVDDVEEDTAIDMFTKTVDDKEIVWQSYHDGDGQFITANDHPYFNLDKEITL